HASCTRVPSPTQEESSSIDSQRTMSQVLVHKYKHNLGNRFYGGDAWKPTTPPKACRLVHVYPRPIQEESSSIDMIVKEPCLK
ncbi:18202_t:CDS:2, partial [Acaulospora morrowiae]